MAKAAASEKKSLKVAIVAGEASGDFLGSGLLAELSTHYNLEIEGIGGPKMIDQGCQSLYPMERLSVMGIVDVLKRLPELFRIRANLIKRWSKDKPDLYIGIDAPDFNLGLEIKMRAAGIPVVHYVSPTVWAWRPKRIHKIKKAVDLMLTLFPFEAKYYETQAMDVVYVGHPLAHEIPQHSDKQEARKHLGIEAGYKKFLAVLPGSRSGEVKALAPLFFAAIAKCQEQEPELMCMVPAYNEKLKATLTENLAAYPDLKVRIVDGQSQTVMAASDAILLASGTATLEGMLIKRPMVVAYKLSEMTYRIVKNLFSIQQFSLPNLLLGKAVVPELLQEDATPEKIAEATTRALFDDQSDLLSQFNEMHELLRQDASKNAALAVKQLVEKRVVLT